MSEMYSPEAQYVTDVLRKSLEKMKPWNDILFIIRFVYEANSTETITCFSLKENFKVSMQKNMQVMFSNGMKLPGFGVVPDVMYFQL